MRITLDGETVTEAIIDYINKEFDTKVGVIDYPTIEIGKKSYELNFETDITLWAFKDNDDKV
tara:strand:- start:1997 stop:2182 length:186 start_codon:yes stop_codon:yes gene_type:complete